ncbi:MAG: 2-oxoacid:acceptor oxidoreductase family protein, partial [Spirochaetales bacterium]|nr:2-oxoacid:acceptor oxidoreductase family protein [Spirochaetales bacterium]
MTRQNKEIKITHKKPASFYETFERKGPGQTVTHYCPGCGHGTVHKLIAEAIDEMDVQDRTIFLSPVGCSVFGYYYFDTGNVQCSHGRAPAVATGMRRVNDDSIIISYQGDGDLAAIGTTEIVHTANRGENITVFFINNAIYGMTGGQMAPTTLVGQNTVTTPAGRYEDIDGPPIGMAEVMNSLKAPVYIERTTLSTPAGVMKTRKAVKKAIRNQMDKKGFSFVEILSPCPVGWRMKSNDARKWMKDNLEAVFPVKQFRDIDQPVKPEQHHFPQMDAKQLFHYLNRNSGIIESMDIETGEIEEQLIKIAGFGGQGVMSAGQLLANCAIAENMHTTWLPSYGPEMRGGTASASVIISKKQIGSPVVNFPNVLIAMNQPSLESFEGHVSSGGTIFV